MFHHFPSDNPGDADCLVRSTDFIYHQELKEPDPTAPIHAFLASVSQWGYVKLDDGIYVAKCLPPLEFTYTDATIQETLGFPQRGKAQQV